MAINDFLTLATLALAILIVTPFLGRYIHRVMEGERVFLSPIVRPVERLDLSRLRGRRDRRAGLEGLRRLGPRRWPSSRSSPGYVVLRLQDVLPLNQGGIPPMSPGSRLQHVGQLRDQHQLAELLGRDRRHVPDAGGDARRPQLHLRRHRPGDRHRPRSAASPAGASKTIGNYWVDLTRGILYILLPISIVGALVLVWQGVPQTWDPSRRSPPCRARSRRSPSVRSRRRSSSRSSATTAAGSSTPTRPIRSRARRR